MPALFNRLLHSQLRQGAAVPSAPPLPGAQGAAGGAAPAGHYAAPSQYQHTLPHIHSTIPAGPPVFPHLQPPAQQPLPPHLSGQLPASLQAPLRPKSGWGGQW